MKHPPMAETTESQRPDEAQEEQLLREAMALFEQKRYSEALLACEGALVLNPQSVAALALKGAIHERLGQVPEAIQAYEQVLKLNPLSVSERVRLEALRGQVQQAGKAPAQPPLWKETLPVVLAFMGTSLVLIVGLVLVLKLSVPPPQTTQPPSPPVATTELTPAPPPTRLARPAEEPDESPVVSNPAPSGAVPPVVIDPSRVALAPSNPPDTSLRGSIAPLPSPERETRERTDSESRPPRETSPAPSTQVNRSEVMPDVQVRETEQRGVYEIRVYTAGSGQSVDRSARSTPSNTALTQAQNYQMAGNFREALNAYRQALEQAEFKGPILQQMAICYFRLGEIANARQHFQRAIAEYERQIQQGREVETARQGIRACQDGLRLCDE